MDKNISVTVISGPVGKSPQDITYSFIFDEAYHLAGKGVRVHVIRSNFEEESLSYGVRFHGLKRKVDVDAIKLMIKNLHVYLPVSLLRKPTSIY